MAGKEDIDTELMQLVLAILNSADNLKTNGHLKWKSSIIQTVVSTAVMSRPIKLSRLSIFSTAGVTK